ncbi:MAG: FYDLN acid domain-containing protein [Deltaproteobacteria bacterium]|nr:FYDLN acid domain-containing protein [Deltaproteobacteria bacterium]MBI3293958.1 FYDLN acid domain-containing protein [Deltaproteobacteria bacterium]
MRKAPAKAQTSVNLGTKRYCSHCNVKFYDFGKEEINCPKCNRIIDPKAQPTHKRIAEPKKAAPVKDPFDDEADVVVEDALESAASDDDGDDTEVTQSIDVDTDDDQDA